MNSISTIQPDKAHEEGWLDLKEVAISQGVTRQAVHKAITAGAYPPHLVRTVPSRGPAGAKYQIHEQALSPQAREALRASRAKPMDARVAEIIEEQTSQPAPATALAIQRAKPRQLREAARKAALVEAFRACATKAEKVSFAKQHRIPLSSIYRWCARYDGSGASLLPPPVGRRRSPLYEQAKRLAVDLYLRPERPTPEQVLRALRATLEPQAVPSRATLYRWLADEDLLGGKGTSTYVRWGEKVYRDKAEPIRRRDWSRIPPNHTWVGDHHQYDLLVILPDGTIGRPWLTAWQDGHSRAIVGYTVNRQPCSLEIGLALRNGVLPKDDEPFQGLPVQVYVDNGKDYRSKLLNGTTVPVFRQTQDDPVWGLLGHLGIKTRFCEAYHGKSKPIERLFGTLERGWICLMKGYCGRSPQHRPEHLMEDVAATQLWLESGGQKGQRRLMTWWEMEVEMAEAIRAYNRRPHSSLGWNGQGYRTPAEAYAAGLGGAVRMPLRETLDMLILPSVTRMVRNDGIHLHNALYWHANLAPLIGQEVEVRYDPRDRSQVMVIRKGAFVAWATEVTGVAPFAETEEELDELRAFLAGNAKARKEYRERRKVLLAQNPLAAMTPAARELAPQGIVVHMPHVTGYDRAARAAARAQRAALTPEKPATPAQAAAVGELLVWEFQRRAAEERKEDLP